MYSSVQSSTCLFYFYILLCIFSHLLSLLLYSIRLCLLVVLLYTYVYMLTSNLKCNYSCTTMPYTRIIHLLHYMCSLYYIMLSDAIQILFPALQILLVLAILLIKINPGTTFAYIYAMYIVHIDVYLLMALYMCCTAGPTVRLLGSSYKTTPFVSVSADIPSAYKTLNSHLSPTRMALHTLPKAAEPSTKHTSSYLLESNLKVSPATARLATYRFNDQIPVSLTLNWAWIKANINYLLSDAAITDMIFSSVGPQSRTVVIPTGQTSINLVNRINSTIASNTALVNSTGLSTSATITSFITNSISSQLNKNQTVSLALSTTSIAYQPSNENVVIHSLTITAGTQTLTLGDVTITLKTLVSFLPTTTDTYSFSIPSRYTILHNTSSYHAMAIFNGELRSAFFQTCSPASPTSPTAAAVNKNAISANYPAANTTSATQNSGFGTGISDFGIENVVSAGVSASEPIRYIAKNHPLPLAEIQSLSNQILLAFLTALFILIPVRIHYINYYT